MNINNSSLFPGNRLELFSFFSLEKWRSSQVTGYVGFQTNWNLTNPDVNEKKNNNDIKEGKMSVVFRRFIPHLTRCIHPSD